MDKDEGVSFTLVESLLEELQELGVKVAAGDASSGELQELLGQLKDKANAFKWIQTFQSAKATKEQSAGRTQARVFQALKTAAGMIQAMTAQIDKLGPKSISETRIIILNRVLKDANVPPVDATKPGWFEELKFSFGLGGAGPAVQPRTKTAAPRRSPELQRFMETQGR